MIWKISGYISLILGTFLLFISNSEWTSIIIIIGILLLNKGKK